MQQKRCFYAVLWSALVAFLILLFGQTIWTRLLAANFKSSPRTAPWSVPAMAVVLWLLWQYLGGRWSPRSTSESRKRALRANPFPFYARLRSEAPVYQTKLPDRRHGWRGSECRKSRLQPTSLPLLRKTESQVFTDSTTTAIDPRIILLHLPRPILLAELLDHRLPLLVYRQETAELSLLTPRCEKYCLSGVGIVFKLIGDEGSHVDPRCQKRFRL